MKREKKEQPTREIWDVEKQKTLIEPLTKKYKIVMLRAEMA